MHDPINKPDVVGEVISMWIRILTPLGNPFSCISQQWPQRNYSQIIEPWRFVLCEKTNNQFPRYMSRIGSIGCLVSPRDRRQVCVRNNLNTVTCAHVVCPLRLPPVLLCAKIHSRLRYTHMQIDPRNCVYDKQVGSLKPRTPVLIDSPNIVRCVTVALTCGKHRSHIFTEIQ